MAVGKVVGFSRVAGAQSRAGRPTGTQESELESSAMADVLGVCSEVIGSTISDRIRELGGTDRDVREIAKSAAFAIFVRSAGELFGV